MQRAAPAIAVHCVATCTALRFPPHNRNTWPGAPRTAKNRRLPKQEEKGCAQSPTLTPIPRKHITKDKHPAVQNERPQCSNRSTTAFYSMKSAQRAAPAQFSSKNATSLFRTKRRGLQPKLLYQIAGMPPAVDDKEHETDIHTYTALQGRVEADVARHGIPVAVKGQADELTAPVEHGTA